MCEGISQVSPGAELALLVADPEANRAAEDEPELLVVVAVLGDDRAGVELDDRERQPLAVYWPPADPLPDLLRDRADVIEGAHSIGSRKTVSPRSGGVENPLAQRLLAGEFAEGDTIRVDAQNGELVFENAAAAVTA